MKIVVASVVVSLLAIISDLNLPSIKRDLDLRASGLPPEGIVFPDDIPVERQKVLSKLSGNPFEAASLWDGLDSKGRRLLTPKDSDMTEALRLSQWCDEGRKVCHFLALSPLWVVMFLVWSKVRQVWNKATASTDANQQAPGTSNAQEVRHVVS